MSTNAPLISILDDEPQIRLMLADALEAAGFRTASFGRATEFEASLHSSKPDICLVDLGLPDKDGLALVHRLATDQGAAIIIISGRNQVQDKITGLELGADDYIIKPFDPAEVVARARALLRRGKSNSSETSQVAKFAGWSADFDQYLLTPDDGAPAPLSQAEGEVLRLFLNAPNRLISRAFMQESLGGDASDSFDRAMDVRVSRLRTKLRDDPKNPKLIKTIYGAGYIFLGTVDWQ
ncbi:response regulator transcription factor [Amylibacter sp. IMCC11727]|uniref:response regulator transcription factor n=1 Tax=Amylibacter sp. IMCC11727 TaxID=3039851 RepID=UPI00244E4551|nr:response regulator transcription factor [Amylibacter sp. IMCC11727]WGI22616.1 response regulator transcription factor [Amylibacter sp. IMCC11727]